MIVPAASIISSNSSVLGICADDPTAEILLPSTATNPPGKILCAPSTVTKYPFLTKTRLIIILAGSYLGDSVT
jgi:hypothetical protein